MDFLSLLAVALSVSLFGFCWAYERLGPRWSAFGSLFFLFLSSLISAYTEADATTVAKQFAFNVTVFNAFAFGYTIGYPYKRPWWKKTALVTGLTIVVLLCYTAFTTF